MHLLKLADVSLKVIKKKKKCKKLILLHRGLSEEE